MYKKILLLSTEYRHTTVVSGSRSEFFFVFWVTKLFSRLAHRGGFVETIVRRIIISLPKRKFIIKNSSGVFSIEAYDDSLTICSEYFEAALRPWLARPKTQDLCIDIGANRGLYSILACTQYGYKNAYAFEPNLDMVKILTENITLNHLENKLHCFSVALGDREAEAAFTVDPLHKGGGRLEATTRSSDTASTVTVTTLDLVLSDADKKHVSFVKIDTEGYELAVLRGMQETLAHMPSGAVLMIESTDLPAVESLVTAHGFTQSESQAHDHLFIKTC